MKFFFAIMAVIFAFQVEAKSYLAELFDVKKPIMAALYLELPEDLGSAEQKQKIIDYAFTQMDLLVEENVESVLWEYRGGGIMKPKLTAKQLDVMVEILKTIIDAYPQIVVGTEILWHYPKETLLLAKRSGAKYVRLDFFSDEMIADGIQVPINPQEIINYRKKIGAEDIALFTDIQVKYARMVDPKITITESASNAVIKGSQGLIVSGKKSGHPPTQRHVRLAKEGAKGFDVINGSGFSVKNADELLPYLDGIIIGTSISVQTGGPLVRSKVRQLMTKINEYRNNQ